MTNKFALIGVLLWCVLATPLAAQSTVLDRPDISASGTDYRDALRFRGIETEVFYYDPQQPAPPFETQQAVRQDLDIDPPSVGLETTVRGGQIFTLVLMSMIILGIVYLFVLFGGGSLAAFSRTPQEGGTATTVRNPKGQSRPMTQSLQAIMNMTDRNLALVALCKTLLAKVVSAEGVLLQKSWTDRDTLRRVPREHAHRDALQSLVYDSERTQFGGRHVTEEDFRMHISRLRPLMTGGAT